VNPGLKPWAESFCPFGTTSRAGDVNPALSPWESVGFTVKRFKAQPAFATRKRCGRDSARGFNPGNASNEAIRPLKALLWSAYGEKHPRSRVGPAERARG
jgi:hypothetical protein